MSVTCNVDLFILFFGVSILVSSIALDLASRVIFATEIKRKLWVLSLIAIAIAGMYYTVGSQALWQINNSNLIEPKNHQLYLSIKIAIATLIILVALRAARIERRLNNVAALRENQRRLATLIDSLPGIVFSCSNDSHFSMTYLSEGCLKLTGYRSCELMTVNYNAITHPEDLPKLLETINKAISQQQPYVVEYRIKPKNSGEYKWLWEKGNGVFGDRGQLLGLEGFITDITKLKVSEAALVQAEAKYRSIFENAIEGIFQSNFDGQYISVNPALAQIYGYESEQALMCGLTNIQQQLYVEPNRRQEFLDLIHVQGAVTGFESQVYRQDRTVIWICENVRVVKDPHGAALYYEGTVEDITVHKQLHQQLESKVLERTFELSKANYKLKSEIAERKQAQLALRLSEERYRAVVEQTSEGIFLIDASTTNILQTNAAFERLLGYTFEELLQLKLEDVVALDSKIIDRNIQQALKAQHCFIAEAPHRRKDGSLVLTEVNVNCIFYGDRQVFCAIVRDITDRKRAEAEKERALAKEKELSDLKSRFVNMASHEFRTPLTTILFSAELVQKYGCKWTQEKKDRHFWKIQTSVNHMTQLLNEVLLIGQAEAGKLEFNPHPIDLNQFCLDLVEEMQITTNKHKIIFAPKIDCPYPVMDEKLLRHIFSNLLANAIKYTPQGGIIDFAVVCQQDRAIFRLRDSGIGIPERDRTKLFDSFHRASNVGAISGTGLGLAIVKKSVDLHGGSITVESEINVGTTFEVVLAVGKSAIAII